MDDLATLAWRHWEVFLPTRFQAIPDKAAFFTDLSKQAEQQILDETEALAGPDRLGEDYLAKQGRLTAARMAAREKVLAEMVLLPAEPGSPMDESDEDDTTFPVERATPWMSTTVDPSDPNWQALLDE